MPARPTTYATLIEPDTFPFFAVPWSVQRHGRLAGARWSTNGRNWASPTSPYASRIKRAVNVLNGGLTGSDPFYIDRACALRAFGMWNAKLHMPPIECWPANTGLAVTSNTTIEALIAIAFVRFIIFAYFPKYANQLRESNRV